MHEYVGKHAKRKHRSKESQTGGTKQARQAYQHCMEVYLTNGYTQSIPRRDGCNHISASLRKALSMAKPRSRKANMEIKHRSKQENIEMQRK